MSRFEAPRIKNSTKEDSIKDLIASLGEDFGYEVIAINDISFTDDPWSDSGYRWVADIKVQRPGLKRPTKQRVWGDIYKGYLDVHDFRLGGLRVHPLAYPN